ncbi:HAD family hydrolase [Kribbella sp. NPDC056951]|uniref:HAD family hydrolase n=1 Tax=Kribbella sp. NPDC056951 TaxID=3345978 RepID=UPI003645AC56
MSDSIASTHWLLLDFDGPICSAFAGYPAPVIAGELVTVAAGAGVILAAGTTDPHEVLRTVHAQSPAAAHQVELALQAAELVAVESATPTAGAAELLRRCSARGISTAIVSNNHGPAVEKYLAEHDLSAHVAHVSGRNPDNVALMKPDPYLLLEAMTALAAMAAGTGFVGDSTSDMEAGRAAGVRAIGYANKPGKRERLASAGADVIIGTMSELNSLL